MSKGPPNAFMQELWDPGKLWVQILFSIEGDGWSIKTIRVSERRSRRYEAGLK